MVSFSSVQVFCIRTVQTVAPSFPPPSLMGGSTVRREPVGESGVSEHC